jgi:hypothetical protein
MHIAARPLSAGLMTALLGVGCAMGHGDLPDDAFNTPANPPPAREPTPPAQHDASAPPQTTAADAGDASVDTAPAQCDPQTVTWSAGASSCSAPSGSALAPGASQLITDSVGPETGTVTITCTAGALTLANAICVPPQVIDVHSPTGCVHGYCSAAISGVCGSSDPAKATAICKFKGYNTLTASTITSGPLAAECNADGSSCFQNANSSCNTVFSTVTCTY